MNIIAIGYFDDFARFFLKIKKELKVRNAITKINFNYFSLYLSGFLFFILRFKKVNFISCKVWFNKIFKIKKYRRILKNQNIYKGVNINDVINYHVILDSSNEEKYKLEALSYIDVIENYFKRGVDLLLLSGDTRMSIEIFDFFGKKYNVKTYYFEQGPFGTTIWDNKGVNANASIRGLKLEKNNNDTCKEDIEGKVRGFMKRERSVKYNRNLLYRVLDICYQKVFRKVGLFPLDTSIDINIDRNSTSYDNLSVGIQNEKKHFLLVLQVPIDVNMTNHSPFFKNHFSIVKSIFDNLPVGYDLIVREHPLFKNKYESELYDFMFTNNIPLDKGDLYKSIKKADVVIVNNSTVGIEAISLFKRVVCLGNSYYDSSDLCIKLNDLGSIRETLNTSVSYVVKKQNVLWFLNYFLFHFLIDGHYRDKHIKSVSKIVDIITNDFEKLKN